MVHVSPGHRRRAGQRGAVAVITAVSALMLIIVAGLVVDLGAARDLRRQSQNASDASALAAANVLYPSAGTCVTPASSSPPCYVDATAAAKTYAQNNFSVTSSAWVGCTDSTPLVRSASDTSCISFTTSDPYKVRVKMPVRTVNPGLSSVVNAGPTRVSSVARATLKAGEARSCGLCVVGTGVSSLGNGDVTVNGGSIHLNGSADIGPGGGLTALPTGTAITTTGTCPSGCSPAAVHAGLIADPLATALTLPPSNTYSTVKTSPCVNGPGIYSAYTFPNSTCTLQAGLYVVTGDWDEGNNTVLQGSGVTLYFTCAGAGGMPRACNSPGETGASFNPKNGNVDALVAPAATPAPISFAVAGYVMIYDRQNTADLTMQGNGDTYYTGTIYAPKATLTFPGNSFINVVNGPVIVSKLYGNGNKGGVNLTNVISATIPSPPGESSLDQ